MEEFLDRSGRLLGEEAVESLASKKVAVFGLGGVGSYTCEALVRSGIGEIHIVDKDVVDVTNINRQLIATSKTVGKPKTQVMRDRLTEINPKVRIFCYPVFYREDQDFPFDQMDYVVDAIDTVTSKILLITKAKEAGVPVISAMGAGNKVKAQGFMVADLSDTRVCPLAKVMRKELKNRGISHVKVVYSEEKPMKFPRDEQHKSTPGSMSYVPGVCGLILAGEVIQDLLNIQKKG